MNTQLIPANNNQEIEVQESDLPELNLRQSNFLMYLLSGCSLTNAYRNAGYDATKHAGTAAWQVANNCPVKNHIDFHRKQIAKRITPDFIIERYTKLIDDAMNEDKPHLYDPEIAVKALQELTKIKGIYAPTNVNVQTVTASIEDIRLARSEYSKEC